MAISGLLQQIGLIYVNSAALVGDHGSSIADHDPATGHKRALTDLGEGTRVVLVLLISRSKVLESQT
jgi:hypothetical protein